MKLLAYIIRNKKRIQLGSPTETILFYINNIIVPQSKIIYEIYSKNKDIDGFLYITYTKESTFG